MQKGKKKQKQKSPSHPSLKMKLQAQTLINSLGILETPTNLFSFIVWFGNKQCDINGLILLRDISGKEKVSSKDKDVCHAAVILH